MDLVRLALHLNIEVDPDGLIEDREEIIDPGIDQQLTVDMVKGSY